MENFDQTQNADFTVIDSGINTQHALKTFMSNVFMWMFVGLAVTTIAAFAFAYNPSLRELLIYDSGNGTGWTSLGKILGFLPLIFGFVTFLGFSRLSYPAVVALFLLYAVTIGMSLFSILLLVYEPSSVVSCFAACSAMFGVMAFLGYTTNQDLTSFGRILMMALVGIIVAVLINLFLGSAKLNYLISIIGVAVFTGLTAYDVQKLKRIGQGVEYDGLSAVNTKKLAILGAFNLYLDFINLFLMLLRLFGKRR